jgi:tetratricopeptide (TPR) repeat protein
LPQYRAKWFEQTIVGEHSGASPLVVIECITPAQPAERTFIERLLAFSATLNELQVAIFLHQPAGSQPGEFRPPAGDDRESLLLLYLCGGRARASDWERLVASQKGGSQARISTRRVGSEVWFCYAMCQDAQWAAATFEGLERKERERLARKVLSRVQSPADYPALALASEIEQLDPLLARQAFPTLDCALTEPRIMAKYFYQLRRWAKHAGDPDLVSFAALNYLASSLCLPDRQTIRLYKVLCNCDHICDKRSLARLYGELGQRLAKAKDALRLKAAAECFQRSRHYIDAIEDLANEEKRSSIAAIVNGEALLAFKQGLPELACQLEETVLAGLQQVRPSSQLAAQEVLLRTNLGDVYLHRLNNKEAALKQYRTAYGLAMRHSSVATKCYIAPKLAEVLMRMGQQEQAIEILETFLARPTDGPDPYLALEEKIILKAQLTLAQAYWQLGQHRRSALWYWRLLQRPHYLAPATLRGISLNLRRCRPEMSPRLKARLAAIVARQEEMRDSLKQVRDSLTSM